MTLSRRNFVISAAACAAAASIGAQSATAAVPATQPFKLVMLGDSLTEGFGLQPSQAVPVCLQALLTERGIPVRVVNAGVSGDTSADVLARINVAVPNDSNGVLIAVGANDMMQLMPPQDLAANLRKMLDKMRARQIPAALAGMQIPSFIRGTYQELFDAVYPTVAREYDVPLYPFMLDGVMLNPELNQDDGIHPNSAGAKIIAQRLASFAVTAFGLHAQG